MTIHRLPSTPNIPYNHDSSTQEAASASIILRLNCAVSHKSTFDRLVLSGIGDAYSLVELKSDNLPITPRVVEYKQANRDYWCLIGELNFFKS
jgi:hypothetical protein